MRLLSIMFLWLLLQSEIAIGVSEFPPTDGSGAADVDTPPDDESIDGPFDGTEDIDNGALGATCWATPQSYNNAEPPLNVCAVVPEKKFAGASALLAKRSTIRSCQRANALDYGCDYKACCYQQCVEKTYCLYLTPAKKHTDSESEVTESSGPQGDGAGLLR